jgi:hypothetical protein
MEYFNNVSRKVYVMDNYFILSSRGYRTSHQVAYATSEEYKCRVEGMKYIFPTLLYFGAFDGLFIIHSLVQKGSVQGEDDYYLIYTDNLVRGLCTIIRVFFLIKDASFQAREQSL